MKKYLIGMLILLPLIIIILIISLSNNNSIIGKWKTIDKDNEYYYIFNKDNTCSYVMKVARLKCTYKEEDSKLSILYAGNKLPTSFKYRFEKNKLIITDSSGKDNIFIKVK